MKKNYLSKSLLSGLIIASILTMSGCSSTGSKADDGKKVDAKKLTQQISSKYAKEETVDYKEKKSNVSRDKGFDFTVSQAAKDKFMSFTDSWTDIITVYHDSSLTQKVAYKATSNDSGVTLSPYRNPLYGLPDKELGGLLYDQGEWNDWGNAQQYFMVTYYDLETGEKLVKPTVTLFTIKTEIEGAPQVEFYVSDKGVGGLRWKEVKGAKEYAVVEVREGKDGSSAGRSIEIIDTVKENKWEDTNKDTSKINWNFRTVYGESFDTYYEEMNAKQDGSVSAEDLANMTYDGESDYDKEQNKYFAVIAMNDKGTSRISNLIDKRMAANQVPVNVANYMNKDGIRPNGENSKVTIDRDIMLTSTHTWVVMGDGSVSQKLVIYDTSRTKEDVTQFYNYEEDENGNVKMDENGKPVNYTVEDVPCLSIPFTIEGTSIKGYAQVLKYDKDNYKKELKELKKRQEKLRDRTGDIQKDVDLNKTSKNEEEKSDKLYDDYDIYASNALSEYLALQMLNGQTRVNLDDFKEAMDQEYLLDAWYEAIYQNPLVLGVKGISYDAKANDVLIQYDEDSETQRKKQVEIKDKVKAITSEIIKDGMTDYEKEEAINEYLCSNAEYDNDALKNAEENNFKKVDEKFNDSFTSYGILMNNKGVCAGYAGSFKLLADAAGLKNIVVTGYLQGSLPHAWNRVALDEQWYSLDTTNNDNEYFKDALFNLSDSEAINVLNEDDLYAMNDTIPTFKAVDSNNEFYRKNSKFYSQTDIVDKLAADFTANGSAVYRTDLSLTEEQFYEIAKQVMMKTGDPQMSGGYFLGVICLTK